MIQIRIQSVQFQAALSRVFATLSPAVKPVNLIVLLYQM